MKKVLKRIVTLVIVATLFVMPASTASAASTPVCTVNEPNCIMFEYQPDPRAVQPSETFCLTNFTDTVYGGAFSVPANAVSNFIINQTAFYSSYEVEIIMIAPATTTVYRTTVQGGGTFIQLPPIAYDRQLLILVHPTGGTPINIASYGVYY